MRIGITGVSGGIGRALCARLAAADEMEVVGFSRSPEASGALALDVTAPYPEIEAAIRRGAEGGGWDAWVNLAGADVLSRPVRHLDYEERLGRLWQVDVEGTIKCCRAVMPYMRRPGLIINVAWDRALSGHAGESGELYAAAKAAVVGYSKSLARGVPEGLAVAVYAPGWVRTRWADSLDPKRREALVREQTGRAWQTADEAAAQLHWMLAAPPGMLNGQMVFGGPPPVL